MAPPWLTTVAWISLSLCAACAVVLAYDIFVNRRRQAMGVMDAVFPITALYFGPFALAFYWRWARAPRRGEASTEATDPAPMMALARSGQPAPSPAPSGGSHGVDDSTTHPSDKPRWVVMAIECSHCGSGCTLGDVISEVAIFALGLTIAGLTLPVEYIGDYLFAVALGILFQYFAIAPMRGLGVRDGVKAAAKADLISLSFFEIGLFGWMALMAFVFFPAPHNLMPNVAAFWFLMQIGMMIGFFTSWPANAWLVNRGIKVAM
jgi:Domain of unknown function (DUF4396)